MVNYGVPSAHFIHIKDELEFIDSADKFSQILRDNLGSEASEWFEQYIQYLMMNYQKNIYYSLDGEEDF